MFMPSLIASERLAPLSRDDDVRYSRNIAVPEVGAEGQERIRAAKVLIVGTGGLGSAIALYLAAAGVGTIGLVDFDEVEESNLQRQIIHSASDIGRPKTASARESILALNPGVGVIAHQSALTSENALAILADYDIIADGTDNFSAKYLLNDACVFLGKPLVHGSASQLDGEVTVFDSAQGPCYRCLYPTPPPGVTPPPADAGVLGVVPGLVGVLQATEILKLIVGGADILIGRLLLAEVWSTHFREVTLTKNPDCPVCGTEPTITELYGSYGG